MKKLAAFLALTFVWGVLVQAAEGPWITNYKDALTKAQQEKKLVLLDFTGSDWCPPCKALHANVLSKEDFLKYAEKNLVLVELDFPRRKKQGDDLKKQNQELSKKFNITGYPTIIILNGEGKELTREVGYRADTAQSFIAKIEKAR